MQSTEAIALHPLAERGAHRVSIHVLERVPEIAGRINEGPMIGPPEEMSTSPGEQIRRFGRVAHEEIHDTPQILVRSREDHMEVIGHED